MKNNQSVYPICKLPKIKLHDKSWLTIHNQFTTYGRNAKEWMRKCALLLPQIEKQQIWRKKRFLSIYDYAAKLAGMNHYQVNEALRIVGKAENLPALKEVINLKGLNAVRPIIAIATEENQQFLAEKAMSMSNGTLRMFIKHYKNGEITTSKSNEQWDIPSSQSVNLQNSSQNSLDLLDATKFQSATNSLPQITLVLQLDPQIADQLQKLKGQGDWNTTIGELLKLRREKLEEQKPATVTNATRPIPAKIEKHALAKTNFTCAFPGCTKPYEILHHVDRFAMHKTHDPDRIIPLCKAHENLAHLGLIENENQPPENWKLRARPDYNDPKYEVDRMVEKFRRQT